MSAESEGDSSLTGSLAPAEEQAMTAPIATSPAPAQQSAPKLGMDHATFPLDEGVATFQWPKALSPESAQDLEDWLQVLLRKVKRSVRTEP